MKSMEKVKLPREVAEAIESLLRKWENKAILQFKNYEQTVHQEAILIRDHFELPDSDGFNKLVTALYIGYEVEQTPGDKVKELFRKTNDSNEWTNLDWQRHYYHGKKDGIKETLESLGMKIEGVNT